ncbi:CBS domain-containing protein [Streptodolium elevatio]
MQPGPAYVAPTIPTDAVCPPALRVGGDMTVEVALSVMFGARADSLLLCDEDDQRIGLVTRARLAAVRDCPSYTDRIRLRDVFGVDQFLTATTTAGLGARPAA